MLLVEITAYRNGRQIERYWYTLGEDFQMTTVSGWASRLLAVFGAGALLALGGCREKPKQLDDVAANAVAAGFTEFSTRVLPTQRDAVAPDGSDVRLLPRLKEGGMIHFELAPNRVSKAVTHRTVEEIWYFVGGRGSHLGQVKLRPQRPPRVLKPSLTR